MKTLLFVVTICFVALLNTSVAMASPPSPDSDSSCGGNCQAVCINGCDSNAAYTWQQARCVVGSTQTVITPNGTIAGLFATDAKGQYCVDGYNCDFGPCGRPGERFCNTVGTGCNACQTGLATGGKGTCQPVN